MDDDFILEIYRAAFVFCLYFLTLTSYLTPIFITKYWGSKIQLITSPNKAIRSKQYCYRMISWLNCTALGIFLGMCFLSIIPNVREVFQLLFHRSENSVKFPVSECTVIIGYIFILLVEQSILTWREKKDINAQDDFEQNQGLLEECELQEILDDLREEQELVNRLQSKPVNNLKCSDENDQSSDNLSISNRIDHSRGHSQISLLVRGGKGITFFAVALAAGFHSVFEGITLGLQENKTKAVHLFVAITIHECLTSAALGINSTRLKYSFCTYFKFAIILGISIPLGMGIGIGVGHTPGPAGEIVSAVLQGISAGIFLYVTFQDFLPSEFYNGKDRILKVFFLMFGFFIFSAVTYFVV